MTAFSAFTLPFGQGTALKYNLPDSTRMLPGPRGVSPEALAIIALRDRFLASSSPCHPRDEWERRLISIGVECGVSLSDAAVSSERLYD
jgi:hypothetical protein